MINLSIDILFFSSLWFTSMLNALQIRQSGLAFLFVELSILNFLIFTKLPRPLFSYYHGPAYVCGPNFQ